MVKDFFIKFNKSVHETNLIVTLKSTVVVSDDVAVIQKAITTWTDCDVDQKNRAVPTALRASERLHGGRAAVVGFHLSTPGGRLGALVEPAVRNDLG